MAHDVAGRQAADGDIRYVVQNAHGVLQTTDLVGGQIDLPSDKVSGLKDAVRILDNVPDIAICRLTASDVVRHALVQRIIAAYETAEHSAKSGLPGQKKVYRRKP